MRKASIPLNGKHGPESTRHGRRGLTVFQTLEEQGHVDYEQEGKAYRYYPTVSREEAGREAVGSILRRVFGGSSSKFLDALADVEAVPGEMAEEIRDVAI